MFWDMVLYKLTGDFAVKPDLVVQGNPTFFTYPPGTWKMEAMCIYKFIPFDFLMNSKSLMDMASKMEQNVSIFSRLVQKGNVIIELIYGEFDKNSKLTPKSGNLIRSVCYNNCVDYITLKEFASGMVNATPKGFTTRHFVTSMNWVNYVKGANSIHVHDWEFKERLMNMDEALTNIQKEYESLKTQGESSVAGLQLAIPPIFAPVFYYNYNLSLRVYQKWVDYFVQETKSSPSFVKTKSVMSNIKHSMDKFNPFSRNVNILRLSFDVTRK